MTYISRQTQKSIRLSKRFGYTQEAIAEQYGVSPEDVKLVLAGLYFQEAPPPATSWSSLLDAADVAMKRARAKTDVEERKAAILCTKYNYCDVRPDWKAGL